MNEIILIYIEVCFECVSRKHWSVKKMKYNLKKFLGIRKISKFKNIDNFTE